MPVVLRISVGAKYGAQHSQDWTALVHHIPGLKVVYPVTPYDAKGMMNSALAGTDPVVFFESQKVYDFGEMFVEAGVPEGYYEIDLSRAFHQADRQGPHHHHVRPGALHGRGGRANAGGAVRTVRGADRSALGEPAELRAAGRVGEEDRQGAAGLRRGGARLRDADRGGQPDAAGFRLPGRAARGGRQRNWITPAAELEAMFFPQPEWLIDAIHERILPLKGYRPSTNQTNGELARRLREGT